MDVKEIITDALIEHAWGNADFGETLNNNKRLVIDNALLKKACGYSNGHTSTCIIQELGLLTENEMLTKKGRLYLWEAFHQEDI